MVTNCWYTIPHSHPYAPHAIPQWPMRFVCHCTVLPSTRRGVRGAKRSERPEWPAARYYTTLRHAHIVMTPPPTHQWHPPLHPPPYLHARMYRCACATARVSLTLTAQHRKYSVLCIYRYSTWIVPYNNIRLATTTTHHIMLLFSASNLYIIRGSFPSALLTSITITLTSPCFLLYLTSTVALTYWLTCQSQFIYQHESSQAKPPDLVQVPGWIWGFVPWLPIIPVSTPTIPT